MKSIRQAILIHHLQTVTILCFFYAPFLPLNPDFLFRFFPEKDPII